MGEWMLTAEDVAESPHRSGYSMERWIQAIASYERAVKLLRLYSVHVQPCACDACDFLRQYDGVVVTVKVDTGGLVAGISKANTTRLVMAFASMADDLNKLVVAALAKLEEK